MSLRPKKVNFSKRWATLSVTFSKLLTRTEFQASASDLLSDVYDLCTARPEPYTERLLSALQELFAEFVVTVRRDILQYDDLLERYSSTWEKYYQGASNIDLLCKYLNQRLQQQQDPAKPGLRKDTFKSVEAIALAMWKVHMVDEMRENYGNKLMYQVFEQIQRDRDGETVNLTVLGVVIRSLVTLSELSSSGQLTVYQADFEEGFLAQTREFYARESAQLISSYSMSDYMRKVEKRLKEESLRAEKIADVSTHDKVIKVCENETIAVHTERFYGECRRLIEQEHTEDFSKMYHLLSRLTNVLKPMLKVLEDYVIEAGIKTVEALGDTAMKEPEEYVEALLAVHNKYTQMVDEAVKGDTVFNVSIDKAFRVIVNDTKRLSNVKGAELLARYCDVLLKKGAKTALTERDVEEKLGRIIIIFKYVDDKDMFQKFYARMLARRLIFATSVSDESESIMISRLKSACGIEYTTKLQRMFTDMNISKDLNDSFKAVAEDLLAEFNVLVLTAGAWPITQSVITPVSGPPELEKCITSFQNYYNKRYNGRKLTWLYHLSRGDIKVNYLKKRYELQLTLYQIVVLLAFNSGTSFTVAELQQQTQISEQELVRSIKPFTELKLLSCTSQELDSSSVVSLNMDFSNKRTKIKVSGPVLADTKEEAQQTHKQIDVDRQLYLQALIVRIMKTRKHLSHNSLVDQIIREARSRFSPSIPIIKKCIEGLIEKNYLERDEGARDEYVYVA